ncbi:MAG: PDZ domain-containing protein [Fimbriimonadaceae bacterium]|nr:PDZ domain-containing protein [Fimbriimonadaceae bacterium]
MRPKKTPYILLAAGAVLAVAAGATMMQPGPVKRGTPAFQPSLPVNAGNGAGLSAAEGLANLQAEDAALSDLVSAVSGSVVTIRGESMGGTGSGFVYRQDGWIVTNDHVTSGARTVTVVMNDGREFQGRVYSANDRQIDLSVVKIEARDLPVLPLADTETVRPGQITIAVGSPFGLDSTVTIGHVSALNRPAAVPDPRLRDARLYTGMIQTDAAINPGNSGGPLLNIRGEVIGVNSTINTTTGSSAGIGFAIPSNVVEAVADELIEKGSFDRGMLGVSFNEEIKPFRLKELGIQGGVEAVEVSPEGPAAKAGIRPRDIILQIDNEPLRNQSDLLISMYRRSPGEKVSVTYLRGGRRETADLTLGGREAVAQLESQMRGTPNAPQTPNVPEGEMPERMREFFREFGPDVFRNGEPRTRERGENAPRPQGERPRLGVNVEEPTDATRRQFRIPATEKGAVVVTVAPGSLAATMGVRSGDLITKINGRAIEGPQQLVEALGRVQPGSRLTVESRRFSESGAETLVFTTDFR